MTARRLLAAPLLASLASCLCLAQQRPANGPLRAQQFFFDDYRSVLIVDMKAARETGFLEDMGVGALIAGQRMIEDQQGFSLEGLDRITMVRSAASAGHQEILTIEGCEELGQPKSLDWRYTTTDVGAHVLHVDRFGSRSAKDSQALGMVHDKLRVYGPTSVLQSVLEGKPRRGLPCPDVMAFLAGHPNVLLQAIVDVRDDDEVVRELCKFVPGTTWPDGRQPTFVCLRVRLVGDEIDPHTLVELTVRHNTVGDGLAATEAAVNAALAKMAKVTELRILRPLLKKIEHRREGTDAVWSVDCGRSRQVAGMLGSMAPFLFIGFNMTAPMPMQGGVLEVAEAVEVVVEEVEVAPVPESPEPPAPPKPVKPPAKSGGGGS
ncbi:MAG: hypothetical protein AB8H80_08245 [Planctomycetota bacterium]